MNSRVLGGFLSAALLLAIVSGAVEPDSAAAAATTVCHPALRAISVGPASVPGGAPTTVTATLTCAPAKPLAVTLTGSSGVTVPRSVTVPAGKISAAAGVRTAISKTTIRRSVTGAVGTVRKSATVTITPTPKTCANPVLRSASLATLAYVGNRPTLTVGLSCAAAAPVRITLKSSDSFLPVPAAVTVGKYYASAAVALTPKADEEGRFTATITITSGKTVMRKTITVDPGISNVAIDPNIGYPDQINLVVLTAGIVPAGGLTVKLSSNSPAVTVPATFVVPAPSVGSEVLGVVVNQVSKNTTVTISATLGGVTKSASYVLVPPWTNRGSVTIGPENGPGPLYGLENYVDYYLSLSDPAPASGLTADVTLGDPDALQFFVPPPVTFAPGQESTDFEVDVANVTAPVHTTISVTVDGVTTQTPVTIEPGLASFSLPATLSTGTTGATGTGTITLAGPVDTATTVDLQSTWGILTVPLSVTIPAGGSSATFPISVVPVTSDSPVSIVAMLGTSTLQSDNIDVTP
ncbi:MAG TPA: hypothetical protein VIL16_20105 [Trebonia sp.]